MSFVIKTYRTVVFYFNCGINFAIMMINLFLFISLALGASCQVVSYASPPESDMDYFSSNKTEELRPLLKENGPFRLNPLAAGGIGLLAGLVLITATVGIFIIATKRRNQFVYESAPAGDVTQHI